MFLFCPWLPISFRERTNVLSTFHHVLVICWSYHCDLKAHHSPSPLEPPGPPVSSSNLSVTFHHRAFAMFFPDILMLIPLLPSELYSPSPWDHPSHTIECSSSSPRPSLSWSFLIPLCSMCHQLPDHAVFAVSFHTSHEGFPGGSYG